MTIRYLSKSEAKIITLSTPLCVIGGGIAGLLIACRIAKSGRRVVLIESGYTSFDADIHKLNEIDDPTGRYTRALDGRFRGLGGSSSRWGGRMIPISAYELGPRPDIAQPAWPIDTEMLDDYEREIEAIFQIDNSPYDNSGSARVDPNGLFPRDEKHITRRWAKCPDYRNCNVATLLAKQLKDLKNLDIWLGATVCDFSLDSDRGRLRGIAAQNLNGNTLSIVADDFILAAGAIESTRLLHLLDAKSEGRAFAGCHALGRYFQDHLKAKVATINRRNAHLTNRLFAYRFVNSTRRDLHLELSEHAQRQDASASAFAYIAMDLASSPLADLRQFLRGLQKRDVSSRQVLQLLGNGGFFARAAYWRYAKGQVFIPEDIDLGLMVCAEQLPVAANRIRLSDKDDRFGMRKARIEWTPTYAEEHTFRTTIRHLDFYWRNSGFDRFCPLKLTPAAENAAIPIIDDAEACAHPSGSTRMGLNPPDSVVGPDLRCHAVPNIAVASSSVFPTAGSANPTFTIMKMALWLADSYLGGKVTPKAVLEPTA